LGVFRSLRAGRLIMGIGGKMSIEHLHTKARQMLAHYCRALDCSAVVLNTTGQVVKTNETKGRMRFCELCRKHCKKNSTVLFCDGVWKDSPCEKLHINALAESRNIDSPYIYSCPLGFAYWTSPLYRNEHYAGAVTAGHVLLCNSSEAVKKFYTLSKDKNAAEKLSRMLEEIPEKNQSEIQAMALLLGICANEISEKGKDYSETIHRISLQQDVPKFPESKLKTGGKTFFAEDQEADNSMEKERLLIAAFQRGDQKTGKEILNELIENIPEQDLTFTRFRAIELVVLLSRAALNRESSGSDALFEANSRDIKKIQESNTKSDLLKNLHYAAERMAGKIFSFQGIRHASVLRKAQRYIWENYDRKISLEEISKASGLSSPYFSTVFKEEMGENLTDYLNRLRVEKAVTLLTETEKPLTEISGLCGFQDQSWFSKLFKSFIGISPGKYRETGGYIPDLKQENRKKKREILLLEPAIREQNIQAALSS